CSSLSQKQCLSENWHAIGERDGANGHTEYRITDHQETCAKYGIVPDMPEHEAGRQEGLKRYCTAVGGLQAGRYANSYAGVCEAENEDAFLAGFKLGQDIYDMELRVNAVRSEYDLARNRLADIDRSRREQDRETNSDGKRRERDALRLRLRELERDLWRADDDLRQLEWAARRMR
ncbi:MAG TPA: DUF2799 domain-containing protein, partial [Steroidobacteraceae bacterium]|nr:DUF2799 domain-containing protein [Steroidobacteraceae bacterium]